MLANSQWLIAKSQELFHPQFLAFDNSVSVLQIVEFKDFINSSVIFHRNPVEVFPCDDGVINRFRILFLGFRLCLWDRLSGYFGGLCVRIQAARLF